MNSKSEFLFLHDYDAAEQEEENTLWISGHFIIVFCRVLVILSYRLDLFNNDHCDAFSYVKPQIQFQSISITLIKDCAEFSSPTVA